jgi:3-isopropylmalate/(R)-2-methylmalate dehydratase small subunit
VLNQPRYQGAQILLTRANFGCGSRASTRRGRCSTSASRPSSPSPLPTSSSTTASRTALCRSSAGRRNRRAVQQVEATPGYKLVVDLPAQAVIRPDGNGISFEIDAFRKECLLNGWDDIGLTLRHAEKIREFEEKRRIEPALAVCLTRRIQ